MFYILDFVNIIIYWIYSCPIKDAVRRVYKELSEKPDENQENSYTFDFDQK